MLAQIYMNIANGLSNPHVRWPLFGAVALKVAQIWFPQFKPQLTETAEVLMMYGIIGASNSGGPATTETNKPNDPTQDTMKNKLSLLIILALGLLPIFAGCATHVTSIRYGLNPDGTTNSIAVSDAPFYNRCILKESTRFFGFQFKQDPKTQVPYAVLGWGSEVAEMVPTADGTNGISAPRTMSAFDLHNSLNPFATSITENSGSGDVYIGGTNDTSKAIVPSPFIPQR